MTVKLKNIEINGEIIPACAIYDSITYDLCTGVEVNLNRELTKDLNRELTKDLNRELIKNFVNSPSKVYDFGFDREIYNLVVYNKESLEFDDAVDAVCDAMCIR